MELSRFFKGYVELELRGKDKKRFFQIAAYHGILFWNIMETFEQEKKSSCCIQKDQYDEAICIAQRTETELLFVKEHGLPVLKKYIKYHIWFLAGAVMALFLLVWLSGRLWSVRIDGNQYYDTDAFLRFFEEEQIKIGMSLKKADCHYLSDQARKKFSYISWASAEKKGCALILHIKESRQYEAENEKDTLVSGQSYDLIAEKDGVVESIFVRSGIAQAEAGEAVKKGEVLISGKVPICNDGGEVVAEESVAADGDVYLFTEYAYYAEQEKKGYRCQIVEENSYPMLQLGSYRLTVRWPFYRTDQDEGQIYENRCYKIASVLLSDHLVLPVRLGTMTQYRYKKEPKICSEMELKERLEEDFRDFCINLEKKGVQIYKKDVKMSMADAVCVMSGKISVIEKTGRLIENSALEDYGNEMEE